MPLNTPACLKGNITETSAAASSSASASSSTEEASASSEPTPMEDIQVNTLPFDPLTLEPLFRVTGKRQGNHAYKSPELAGAVGAGIIDKYGWKVSLKQYNMEVLADLTGDTLTVGICLSPNTLYNRHRSALGVTSLRPSIAYWYVLFKKDIHSSS